MRRRRALARWFIVLVVSFNGLPAAFVRAHAGEAPIPLYIQADFMERRPAEHLLRFRGSVDVKYGESHITADFLELNAETGEGVAEGHVHYEDPQQRLQAERAEFNLFTRVGTLYNVAGSLQGTSPIVRPGETPQRVTFYLTAERVVRETEDRYRIRRGSLTTCAGPHPAWQFQARDATVEVEGYAHLMHATFWIRNVPVFYTPYFVFPTKRERATGFLPPTFGTSERLGFFLDNRFFWAIDEQSDSTIGVDYLSRRGVRPSLEYRYVLSHADRGQFNALYLDDELTGTAFWKVSGTSQHNLPGQVRSLLALDLVNRENYDRTFEVDNLYLRTRRATDSIVAFDRNWDDSALDLHLQQLRDVENLADETLLRYPQAGFHLLPTVLPWGSLTVGLEALATNFRLDRDRSLGDTLDARRVNLLPSLAWTWAYRPWLSLTPFLGWHQTLLDQTGQASELQSVAILGAELRGPQFSRIFASAPRTRYKHLVEPSLTYTWIPSFDQKTRRQPFDIVDDVFPRNDVALSLTNRLYGSFQASDGRVETRELAWVRISQGVDLTGQRGGEFTRLAPGPFFADLSLEARAQLTATLSLRADAAFDYEERRFDAANAGLFLQPLPFWTLSLERRFRRDPTIDFINGGVGLTLPKGWSLAYSTGYNARDNAFAGNAVTALYRSQCWSLSLRMVQRADELRFAFQIGLDSFLLPRVGF
jgi:LPS-assembly protein